MTKAVFNIKIMNEKFGTLLSETFVDPIQFKIFLKMVDGALNLNVDLSYFDGDKFLVHIPNKILKESVVITGTKEVSLSEQVRNKIETLIS
jgi:hypothetical protein